MRLTTLLLTTLVLLISTVSAAERGLAWGTDNRWGTAVAKGLMKWYWHWQDGPVSQFDGKLEFVPCFWGPSKTSQWNQRKSEMAKNLPKAILAFNEPDVARQANMDASSAASLFKKEIWPYKAKGVQLGSPQIVYNIDWLSKFMSECDKLGCSVDFVALHWYGAYNEIAKLKSFVTQVHQKFGKPIWITEYGVTTAGGGSQSQVDQFHQDATDWFNSQSFVERTSNFGSFAISSPPDNYGSAMNALFNGDGSLRTLAHWYVNSGSSSGGGSSDPDPTTTYTFGPPSTSSARAARTSSHHAAAAKATGSSDTHYAASNKKHNGSHKHKGSRKHSSGHKASSGKRCRDGSNKRRSNRSVSSE